MIFGRQLRRSGCLAWLALVLLHAQLACSDEQPAAISLQRIAVPEGRIDDIGVTLLPVDRIELRKTVSELNSKYQALYGPAQPTITQARYTARFAEQQLVMGSAELDIKHPHAEPAQLKVTPLGIAIHNVHWKDLPDTPIIAGALSNGLTNVRVTESATLAFDWSLQGTVGPEHDYRFDLSLPKAATTEVQLELPTGLAPECANSVITELGDDSTVSNGDQSFRKWRLQLGSISETELRVVPVRDDSTNGSTVLVAAASDYRISTTGLELQTTYQLDVYGHPLRTITIDAGPTLQISQVRLGANLLALTPATKTPDQRNRYSLRLPISILDGPHELVITAYSPVVTDKSWALPTLHLNGVSWKKGTASLQIVAPLQISHFDWPNALLRSFEPLAAPASGESRTFDILHSDTQDSDLQCKLFLVRQQPQLKADTATSIKLNESTVTAEFAARLVALHGDIFSINVQSGAGWIVDSTETTPPLVDRIEPIRSTRGLGRKVELRKAINEKQPITLTVKAHRRLPSSGALKGIEMRPVTITSDAIVSRLTAVHAELPLQLDIYGDAGIERATNLTPAESRLLDTANSTLIYRDSPNADRLSVIPRSLPPRYHGTIEIETDVAATAISQKVIIRCEPMSTRIASLRVRFDPAPLGEVLWSTIGDGVNTLAATKLGADGNEWEVHLRRARSVPFELLASFSQVSNATIDNNQATESIILASLPDAESQTGAVTVGTTDGSDFSLFNQGLTAVPVVASPPRHLPAKRARYRYLPAQQTELHLTRHGAQPEMADAWIWQSNMTSQIDVNGDITNMLRLEIENVGVKRMTVQLPADSTVDHVAVNGESVVAAPNQMKVLVPLPADDRFPRVAIRYTTRGKPMGSFTRRGMLPPTYDLRCLERTWQLLVPSGYEFATGGSLWQLGLERRSANHAETWEHRLFGRNVVRRHGKPWSFAELWDRDLHQANLQLTQTPSVPFTLDDNTAGDGESDLTLAGWYSSSIPISDEQVMIVLCRSDMLKTFGWASLLVAVACGMWLGQHRFSILFMAVVVATVSILVVPLGFVFIFRSIAFGLMAAVVLWFLRPRNPATLPQVSEGDSMSFRLTQRPDSVIASAIIAITVLALLHARTTFAQEPPPSDSSSRVSIFHVYDPVDEVGAEAGPYVYISPDFFDFIEAFKMRLGTRQAEAVVTRATYSLPLSMSPMATLQTTLSVNLQLDTLAAGSAALHLPFTSDEVQLVEASFDDQRIYPRWNSTGDTLSVDVEIASRHDLKLVLRPLLSRSPNRATLDMVIPTVAQSQLVVTGIDSSKIEVPSTVGAVIRHDKSLDAMLGPANRLQITWSIPNGQPAENAQLAASQLMWLRAESEIISVDTQFSLSVLSGRLDHVDLIVDRRLTSLLPEALATIDDSPENNDHFYRLRYQLDRSYEVNELVTITPQFAITNTRRIDTQHGPLVRLADVSAEPPLLGVSSMKGLTTELTGTDTWTRIPSEELAQAWGSIELPSEAFRLSSEETPWTLVVEPLTPQISSIDSTTLRLSRERAHVSFHSQLQVAGVPIEQISLAAPAGLKVENIYARQQGVHSIDNRFSQADDGNITVFLNGAVSGDIDFALEGSLVTPERGKFDYRTMRVLKSDISEHRLTIVRQPEVLVKLQENIPVSMSPTEPLGQGVADRVVQVMNLIDESRSYTSNVILEIAPNPARCTGNLTTIVNNQSNQWSVSAVLSLQVLQGTVDAIRLRLPRELIGSLKLEPPLPYSVQEIPEQSEPNLVITPPTSIDKELLLRLTATLTTASDGTISAPTIEVLDAPQVERFLVLPKYSDTQEIEWDIRGLEQPTSDERETTYRIRRRRMRAVVREVKQAAGSPRLVLTDVEIKLQAMSQFVGVARFDLVPGALERCDLVQPPGIEMVQVSVDGIPALLQRNNSVTTIELQAERLPQRISVVFAGRVAPLRTANNRWSIAAPTIKGLESQLTLWSLRGQLNDSAFVPLLDHALLDSDATRRQRNRTIDEILAYSIGSTSQLHALDLEQWISRWEQRKSPIANPDKPTAQSTQTSSFMPTPHKIGSERAEESESWTCLFEGTTPQLTIVQHAMQRQELILRLALATTICVGAGFVIWLSRFDQLRDFLSRWPYVPGVIAGIIWWLWLAPSVIGWLIILAFVAGALRPTWRTRATK